MIIIFDSDQLKCHISFYLANKVIINNKQSSKFQHLSKAKIKVLLRVTDMSDDALSIDITNPIDQGCHLF